MQDASPGQQSSLAPDPLWRAPVVIGTPVTIAGVASQLASLDGAPRPLGCVVAETATAAMPPAHGTRLAGLEVLGTLDDLPRLHAARRFSVAILSLPRGVPSLALRARARLRQLGVPVRVVTPLADMLARADAADETHRPGGLDGVTDLAALIGRTAYGIDRRAVARVIEGRRVLVTGAGGSIGSEICRIAATFRPAELILMERAENALFEIDRQIARSHPTLVRRALLHDVVDAEQTLRHLVAHKPHVIFHAAAHKHVPLMEDHPSHAVTNNLFGTKSIADAALATGCERFVMISSDKAVHPTSVMGATKRLAEMYVQGMNASARGRGGSRTSFTMVRFGNVLGSACSVLPIWGAQLAEGGPITVTDPGMTRYFMTIAEAATLVIQAAAIDAHDTSRGEAPTIFVLDMGEPIRILDLARRFVMLHGFEPRLPGASTPTGREIDIIFTGARPGEKLHEELAYDAEALVPTPFPGILALAASGREEIDLTTMVADLSGVRSLHDRARVVEVIRRHVPEMGVPYSVQKSNAGAHVENSPSVVAA